MAQTKIQIDEKYVYQYRNDYATDLDVHENYTGQNFDAWEAMLTSVVYDSVSGSQDKSKITDSYSTTLAKERADRVIAKLPDGVVESIGKAQVGEAMFMDILRRKWIYPNANAQHSFLEKMNMWQLYSSVYGYMPMFYDWNSNSSGYDGPDCWLWNPRNLIPQVGRTSIADMDYVTALTWVGKKWIQNLLDELNGRSESDSPDGDLYDGWDVDALELLLEVANSNSSGDTNKDTKTARDRTPNATRKGICLATRYEAGEDGQWVTFAPNNGAIQVRKLSNPHKNGRIPFVIKYSQPLFDSFYGLGDFQRAQSLQFARDGLTNLYFEGIKMNLVPPMVANANGVIKSTLDYRVGGVMLETIPNSIRRLETSTAGLATFQAAQSNLTGSLLSLYGSQNASIASGDSLNPSQGKTPQAINLYTDKEADRDGSERRHLLDAMSELTMGFFSLICNLGTETIPVGLFAQDIEDIVKAGYGDIKGLFTAENFTPNSSDTAGVLKIKPSALKGCDYRFIIDPDSTAQQNKAVILQNIKDFITELGQLNNVITQTPQITVRWDIIMKDYETYSEIPNAAKYVEYDPNAQAPAPPQAPPSATAVQMPASADGTGGGQVHEVADLGKMFVALVGQPGTTDTQNAILQAMGLPPIQQPQAPQPSPTIISSGHAFNDPDIAAAAQALHLNLTQPSPAAEPAAPSPEPTVTSSGHVFNDATIAQSADAIHQLANTQVPINNAQKGATK